MSDDPITIEVTEVNLVEVYRIVAPAQDRPIPVADVGAMVQDMAQAAFNVLGFAAPPDAEGMVRLPRFGLTLLVGLEHMVETPFGDEILGQLVAPEEEEEEPDDDGCEPVE